jgi:hypothetical protein
LPALPASRQPRRYQSNPFSPPGVYHHKNARQRIHADCDPTLLVRAFVANGDGTRVFQCRHRVGETNAVFAKVRSGLGRIPFDRHPCVLVYTATDSRARTSGRIQSRRSWTASARRKVIWHFPGSDRASVGRLGEPSRPCLRRRSWRVAPGRSCSRRRHGEPRESRTRRTRPNRPR